MTQMQEVPLIAAGERYEMLKRLGKGAFGAVQLARDKQDDKLVAIKFIECDDVAQHLKNVRREVENHCSLQHPHVIDFKRCILTDTHLGIVMEYASGGSLFDHVAKAKGLCETDARWFFKQLILALHYCHAMGVSNRDIKLENTLLEAQQGNRRPMLKLCDFGFSISAMHSVAQTEVGTPNYCAPEVLMRATMDSCYDGKKADVWSSGVMLYVMLACRYPFEDPSDARLSDEEARRKIMQRTLTGRYSWPFRPAVSREARDLVARMICVDVDKRITFEEIQVHPWFRKDWPLLDLDQVNAAHLARRRDVPAEIKELLDSIRGASMRSPDDHDEFGALVEEINGEEEY